METAAIIAAVAFAVLIAFGIVAWIVLARKALKMQDRVMDSFDRDDINPAPRRVRGRQMR